MPHGQVSVVITPKAKDTDSFPGGSLLTFAIWQITMLSYD